MPLKRKNDVEQYRDNLRILTNHESTNLQKVKAVKQIRRQITPDSEPPSHFSRHLIDVLVGLLRDAQGSMEIRTEVIGALVDLLRGAYPEACSPVAHWIVEKGGLELLERCMSDAATDEKLRDICILGARRFFEGCIVCRVPDRDLRLIETTANLIVSGTIRSLESTRGALICLYAALCTDFTYRLQSESLFRVLLSASMIAIRAFEDDACIVQHSLRVMQRIQFPPESIGDVMTEPGLIGTVLKVIDKTKSHSVISSALGIIYGFVNRTPDLDMRNTPYFVAASPRDLDFSYRERLVMTEGFVPIIGKCLDSSMGDRIRSTAQHILQRLAFGPHHHVDLLLTDRTPILALVQYMTDPAIDSQYPDSRLHEIMTRSAWNLLVRMFTSLIDNPRPTKLSLLLGEGVLRFFLKYASEHRAHNHILQPLMVAHPEYGRMVEEAGFGHLIRIPWRRGQAADYFFTSDEPTEI